MNEEDLKKASESISKLHKDKSESISRARFGHSLGILHNSEEKEQRVWEELKH